MHDSPGLFDSFSGGWGVGNSTEKRWIGVTFEHHTLLIFVVGVAFYVGLLRLCCPHVAHESKGVVSLRYSSSGLTCSQGLTQLPVTEEAPSMFMESRWCGRRMDVFQPELASHLWCIAIAMGCVSIRARLSLS